MKWLLAGCALCASACLPLKGYTGAGDGGLDGGPMADASATPVAGPIGVVGPVSAGLDGAGGAWVGGPGYLLHFDDHHAHFPDSFVVNGHEALAKGSDCGDAANMGIKIVPTGVRSADAPDSDGALLEISESGPVVARVTIAWQTTLPCGTAKVTSWWSFFPDGRISRYDTVSGTASLPNGCTCGTSNMFETHVETAFKHALYPSLISPGPVFPTADSGGGMNVKDRMCMTASDHKLMTIDGPGPINLLFPTNENDLAVEYRIGDVVAAMIGGDVHDGTTSILVLPSSKNCDTALFDSVLGYQSPPEIEFNHSGQDNEFYGGVAGGYVPSGDFGFGNLTNPMVFTWQATAPAGYAVGLRFATGQTTFTVKRGATTLTSDEVKFQMGHDPTQWIMWLRDATPAAVELTISEP